MHPVISANNPLLKLFHLNVTVVQSDRPGRGWVQFFPERYTYDRYTEYLDPRIDVELVGHFVNWRYSGHVLRAFQQEADNFLQRSMALFGPSPPDVAVIAVHIRRTDRITWLIEKGLPNSMPDRMYFSHVVAFFNRLFDNKTMYVVCSDDVKWSKVNRAQCILCYSLSLQPQHPLHWHIRSMVSLHGRWSYRLPQSRVSDRCPARCCVQESELDTESRGSMGSVMVEQCVTNVLSSGTHICNNWYYWTALL